MRSICRIEAMALSDLYQIYCVWITSWSSVRSRWLDISQDLASSCFSIMDRNAVEIDIPPPPLSPSQKKIKREQQTCAGNSSLESCGAWKAVADLTEGGGGTGHRSICPIFYFGLKKTQKEEKPAWSGRVSNPPPPGSRSGSANVRTYRPCSNLLKKHELTTYTEHLKDFLEFLGCKYWRFEHVERRETFSLSQLSFRSSTWDNVNKTNLLSVLEVSFSDIQQLLTKS